MKMKMKKLLLTFFVISLSISNTIAAVRLVDGMADPDGIILGDSLYFAGSGITSETGDVKSIKIYKVTIDQLGNALASNTGRYEESSLLNPTVVAEFNPSEYVKNKFGVTHTYCFVFGPGLTKLPDQTFLLTFSASFKANVNASCNAQLDREVMPVMFQTKINESCLVNGPCTEIQTFSDPQFVSYNEERDINQNNGVYSNPNGAFSHNYLRIDHSTFIEGQNIWLTYTWFDGVGNNISTVKVNSSNELTNPNLTINSVIFDTVKYTETPLK